MYVIASIFYLRNYFAGFHPGNSAAPSTSVAGIVLVVARRTHRPELVAVPIPDVLTLGHDFQELLNKYLITNNMINK